MACLITALETLHFTGSTHIYLITITTGTTLLSAPPQDNLHISTYLCIIHYIPVVLCVASYSGQIQIVATIYKVLYFSGVSATGFYSTRLLFQFPGLGEFIRAFICTLPSVYNLRLLNDINETTCSAFRTRWHCCQFCKNWISHSNGNFSSQWFSTAIIANEERVSQVRDLVWLTISFVSRFQLAWDCN